MNTNPTDEIALVNFANALHLWGIISSIIMLVCGIVVMSIGLSKGFPIYGGLFVLIGFIVGAAINYVFWIIIKSFIRVFAKISLTLTCILERLEKVEDAENETT